MRKLLLEILIGLALFFTATSAFATEVIKQRPAGLKAQVDIMKQEVPKRFECMVAEIKEAHGNDKSTSLYVLKKNVKAYWDLREGDFPTKIIAKAFNDHPCDFSTALYVIKKDTEAVGKVKSLLNL